MPTDEELQNMVRPVRCFFCGAPMFYGQSPQHVPEVHASVNGGPDGYEDFYAHRSCWDKRMQPDAKSGGA